MKINKSNILRCNFTLQYIENLVDIKNKIMNQVQILDVICDEYYNLNIIEYCSYLNGEIDKQLDIYKCKFAYGKHGWVMVLDNTQIIELKKMDDILSISSIVSFNENIGFTYVIKSELGYKIGFTTNLASRNSFFGVKLPLKWEFLRIYPLVQYKKMEKILHVLFKNKYQHINGEWFNLKFNDFELIDQLYYNIK